MADFVNYMIVKKAKLIYYMNSSKRKYCESDKYIKHINNMFDVLYTFKMDTDDMECAIWLYAANYPGVKIIEDFGYSVYDIVSRTSGQYSFIKVYRNSANLVLIDRIAHVNYFLENGQKDSYNAFFKHHGLFRKELFRDDQNQRLWAYLDNLMEKDWNNLMCV